jgi:hypothetical protein
VRRTLAVVAAAGLLALGCSGGEEEILDLQATPGADSEPIDEPDDPDPEVEETEEPADEPEPEDPYAVPDEIDEDYVERVINAILEVQSEVLRGALQQEQGENLDPDLIALHLATTEGRQRQLGLEEYQGYVDDPEARGGLHADLPAGASGRFEVDYIHHVEADACILALGYWDRSELSNNAPARDETLTAISLSHISDAGAVSEGNPTPWQWQHNLGLDGALSEEEWPALPWETLDHSCLDLNGEGPETD